MRNPTILTVSKVKRYFGTVSFQAPNKLGTVQFSIISQTPRSTVNSNLLELMGFFRFDKKMERLCRIHAKERNKRTEERIAQGRYAQWVECSGILSF